VNQAFSTGLDVKFLCAPLSVRNDSGNINTWALLDEKGENKLLCWTERGAQTIVHTISLNARISNILSILQVDEMGESVALNFNNARLVCFCTQGTDTLWMWEAPTRSSSLKTFRAKDCALTKTLNGFALASISDKAAFYAISPEDSVSKEILSIPLLDVLPFAVPLADVRSRILCSTLKLAWRFSYLYKNSKFEILTILPQVARSDCQQRTMPRAHSRIPTSSFIQKIPW